MRLYIPEARVRRYARIGLIATLMGLACMINGIVLVFVRQDLIGVILGSSFLGLLLTQVGMAFRNQWGRQPRMDQVLDEALKGLDDRYAVFHYLLDASHAVFAPEGVYVLLTTDLDGDIRCEDGAWVRYRPSRRKGRPPSRQRLDDPGRRVGPEAERLRKTLTRRLGLAEAPEIQPILVFVHPHAEVHAGDAPVATVHLKKLKAFLRARPRRRPLPPDQLAALAAAVAPSGAV